MGNILLVHFDFLQDSCVLQNTLIAAAVSTLSDARTAVPSGSRAAERGLAPSIQLAPPFWLRELLIESFAWFPTDEGV
uniref:hypothetical protein n=1 Tax=Cupriavidus taiwanensis TaxID=164546 RepID=UPI0011C04E48|nr:hypothetical protein [Cupriavidus taiwanensis]